MDWATRYRNLDQPSDTPATPEAAIHALLAGNAAFVAEAAPHLPAPSTTGATAGCPAPPRQAPYCVVLGCSDARAPLEIIFDAGPNQFFVVRVAGNSLGDECFGSIEYALHTFKGSVHLLAVVGHTRCGAVAAAVDAYLRPTEHDSIAFTRSLRSVVNHGLIAVRLSAVALAEVWGPGVENDPGYRDALWELSVYVNAALSAPHLKSEPRPDEQFGVGVVFGVFDIASCRVIGPDLDPATDDTSKLAPAPADADELAALGRAVAGYPSVAGCLTRGKAHG